MTLAALRERPRRRPNAVAVPFADRRFGTPSGKVELVGDLAAPSRTVLPGELRLVATKSLRMVNSQIQPEDLPEEPVARLHPESMAGHGLVDGGWAWIESRVGRVRARVAADASVRRDVLVLNPARCCSDLSGANQLREARLTDLGEGAAMHETKVTVSRAPSAAGP